MMIKLRLVLFGEMAIAASMSTAYAGPWLEAKAAAGPTAKEGVPAGMSLQPTPASIAAARGRKARRNIAEKG
jgi:hypothetical protein